LNGTVKAPLYLLDENISYKFVVPFKALRYETTSVEDVWPKQKLYLQGKKSVDDPEIIEWLGTQQSNYGFNSVWITDDWDASKLHAKLILANSISVFWVCDPLNKALRAIEQLQVITMLIEYVHTIIQNAASPCYLKGTIDNRKVRLWTLNCHILDTKLIWKKVVI
jgi:hypothetical protein